jgi:hypothetical protein
MTTRKPPTTALKRRTILSRVRRACLSLPDTHEKEAWGAPTFRARGRQFVMYLDNHHGDGRLAIWCNAPPGAQDALVAAMPKHYFVPPYVGTQGWVGVRLDTGLKWQAVATRIKEAHRITASRGAAGRRSAGRAAAERAPSRSGRGRRRSRG